MAHTIAALEAELPGREMNDLVTEILASSLGSLGLFSNGARALADLSLEKRPASYYDRWLTSSIDYLVGERLLEEDGTFARPVRPLAELWEEWRERSGAWAGNPNQQAQSALLETCLRAVPGIISGRLLATDVMFPSSSMHLVEGVYRGNPQANYFNDILCETLTGFIEERLAADRERKIRIVEIGAGTGGTTATLLPILTRYPVEEYCYTDLSKAFLMYAEKQFKPEFPALGTALFDVSRPLAPQSIPEGHYDFAVAANVLHATSDIRETLRNAKATLCNRGVLLLNEISAWSLFNHLTFGLLEGWWLYEDAPLRLPGSPGLSPERWREILAEEGFESISFPAEEAHRLGQQIVVAVSDGCTRQRIAAPVVRAAGTPPGPAKPASVAAPPAIAATASETAAETSGRVAFDFARQIVVSKLSESLRMDVAMIRDDTSFADYGVDSIVGVNLVRTICEALQIELETTSLFEYSTVHQLTEHILTNWSEQVAAQALRARPMAAPPSVPPAPSAQPPVETPSTVSILRNTRFAAADVEESDGAGSRIENGPIAIIGMSGRFAESESLDAFWDNLVQGRDMVKPVSRWNPDDCVISGNAAGGYCSSGSFVDSIDRFDAAFFGIPSLEAAYMDPQQRLFLEEAWKALEDAGYAGRSVHEKPCGVYVGCGSSSYDRLSAGQTPPQAFWGNSQAVTPARIAYCLNLQGPAMAIDTACSSSLVAIHLACQGLWSGETEMALAGGVFLQPTPGFYRVANRAGMLSADGKCYSFDARANGFVPGEGVGVVVLKRLRDALNDGDHVHGVIAGSGINQDGRSNGLIAPNGRAQERLERWVYDRFGIDPATIQVVEAHGTGTIMGDSIEYAAISRAFRAYTDRKGFCALGTVKTNIGHTSTAAGVAGVLKLLLALKHRRIPPSIHFEKANPAIDVESGPFYVNTDAREWDAGQGGKRRAAVSSFGFSGTNAHLILEEAPSVERPAVHSPAYLVVLSARTRDQLRQQAESLMAHLRRSSDLSMNDLSFSLVVGRTHLDHRLACIARDQAELEGRLEQWLGAGAAADVYTAEAHDGRARDRGSLRKFGDHCIRECRGAATAEDYVENLTAVADLWVQGCSLDLSPLFGPHSRRVPLPTYPFARDRHWVDDAGAVPSRPAVVAEARIAAGSGRPRRERPAAGGAGHDLRGWVQGELSREAAEILPLHSHELATDRVLLDLGFDSMSLTSFAEAINRRFGTDVTPILFFDHPTIAEIADYLTVEHEDEVLRSAGEGTGAGAAPRHADRQTTDAAARSDAAVTVAIGPDASERAVSSSAMTFSPEMRFVTEPIAIVGMAGVMPQSRDLDELWRHLRSANDLITVIPEDRWNWEDHYGDPLKEPNKSNSKWGGFMKEVDKFDPLFFGISPREAQMMDPQQRIFLEVVWKAIEDSGQKVSDLAGTRTGVFVGVGSNDYIDVLRSEADVLDGYTASGNSHSVLANRVSFLLNLRGPSAPVDTACSSSLVALHRAVESIHTRSCDMAIVGGVQVILSPGAYVSFSVAGMLSSEGKCKTFDKRADGYVRGEGCGAILLKPLSAAEADRNHIYAVIRSTAENHGGRVTTLTAPNSSAQAALLVEAYEKARIDPATVGYIECHGTGTTLGDPIEVQALTKAFSELYRQHGKVPATTPTCGLGTIKTNIGHLETAAGIAGVLKVLLAMKHAELPANLHFEELNPYIRLEGTPFYVVDSLEPWERHVGADGAPIPRRAGVSSFGFGGANAHAVLEEYVPPAHPARPPAGEPQLIVVSAKSEERLAAYLSSIRSYLDGANVELVDLAYTLQVGRDEMPERMALVVSGIEELKRKLDTILAGEPLPPDCCGDNAARRQAKGNTADGADTDAIVESLVAGRELSRLAQLWVSGARIDWESLHEPGIPRRISAPTYPFARERYWVASGAERSFAGQPHRGAGAAAYLHPLVHRNVSTLDEQKFASRLSGDEVRAFEYVVGARKTFPAGACLEMAVVAAERSRSAKARVLRNIVWEKALVLNGEARDVEVSLTPGRSGVAFAVRSLGASTPVTHCSGGLSYDGAVAVPDALDVARIRARCVGQAMSGTDVYEVLDGAGLSLGRSFRIIDAIHVGESESLAVLQVPEQVRREWDRFSLHPAVIDGSLHAVLGLMKSSGMELEAMLPASAAEVELFDSLRDVRYAYATRAVHGAKNALNGNGGVESTVQLLDGDGRVLVRMKNVVCSPVRDRTSQVAVRAADARPQATGGAEAVRPGLHSLLPVWNPLHLEPGSSVACDPGKVVLLRDDPEHLEWIRSCRPDAEIAACASAAGIDDIAARLATHALDHLLWIAPDVEHGAERETPAIESLVERQEEGVLAVFRIIKAVLLLGYGTRKLRWTFVTGRTQPVVDGEAVRPAHAGVTGLVGSLAKEYPQWDVRLLDVDSLGSVTAAECLSLPWDRQGNALAHRRGEWFRQALALLSPPQATPLFRRNGTYVVIGGAGGIGEVWTRYMIENYQANVVWIGRRPHDAAIQEKIDSLAALGTAPLYLAADATSRDALARARASILETFPAIDGVVHSAIVLNDHTLARMDEPGFRASLSAKVDTSVNMDLVFGADEPDFMLFFSSIISFGKSAGQSNYSAGCTFKDAFAQRLQQQRRYPVKIMNWGYWGEVGIVKDEAYNKSMAQMGIGSIQPDEGMAALQVLVGSEVGQLALIKTLNEQATEVLDLAETVTHNVEVAPPVLPQVAEGVAARRFDERIDALDAASPSPGMTELATEILASTLASLGVFEETTVGGRLSCAGIAPAYERWLDTTIRYLQQQGVVDDDLALRCEARALADIWTEWENQQPLWGAGAGLQAQIALTEACLRALPAVLAGKQRATDVIFPSSSMHLVEGVYRDNAHADYYNDVLGAVLAECIEQQLRADGERRLRILEIGAGTGGTTAKLLPLLERYRVDEYRYTDLSKAFLMHAGRNFQPRFAPLQTAIFDVSRPLAPQSIPAGHYDFVIAANVLHATPNIRETVRNAKAALKKNGVLLLNEISAWSLFSHVTFGLLEGWWLYEDPAVRLAGNPGLAPETWRDLLADEGFASILFPAGAAHRFGQQIIAASSNGWSRQRIVREAAPRAAAAAKPNSQAAAASQASDPMRRDYVRRVITEKLSEALMIDPTLVRGDAPMTDYGVDSIIGVNLVRTINETLQVELETSSLFECNTVDLLADAILTNCQPVIAVQSIPAQDVAADASHAAAVRSTGADEVHAPIVRRFADADHGRLGAAGVEPIAVIGMSGRFAESESLDALWKHLTEGRSLVREVSRWPASACAPADSGADAFCSQGSFIDRIDEFDAAFFGIAPDEAVSMDPQERLFLHEAWRALEHAGYAGPARAVRGGVYVGCGPSGYEKLAAAAARVAGRRAQPIVPTRVARHLNLHGPAIAVDTGGSSSLVALHLACQALWSDDCQVAVAGGVALHATPENYQAANDAAARADGVVPGEGVGVVVLKRLGDALEDGDHVVGVIAASGIDRDGSADGVAATAEGQERLIDSVYARSRIDPATIRLVEAAGDAAECAAIGRVLRKYTQKTRFSAIGTVKANIGDTGAAAGIAGLLKVLLSLQHRCIPPSLHFERGNPQIDFDSGPMYVNPAIEEWTPKGAEVRRAAVSSFGRSGTNVHVVVEEAPPVQRPAVQSPGSLVALSACTAEQLKRQVRNLLAALERAPELSMNDLSFTLLTGRRHLVHRLACVAQDRADLMARLEQWLETGTATRFYTAVTRERETQGEAWKALANRCIHDAVHAPNAAAYLDNLEAIAELHVQGHALDFDAMFPADTGRIPLPPYPFTGERYWADGAPAADVRARRVHPLLHANTSTLAEQSYRSVFTGEEPFLEERHARSNGHGGHNVLPEAACLEMVRAAIETATGIPAGAAVVELENASWGEPLIVDGARAVTVALLQTDGDALECEVYSGEGEDHRVHCQGRALVLDRAAPVAVDVDALRAQASLLSRDDPGARRLVAPLSVPPDADGPSISAILLNGAVQAGLRLVSDSRGIRAKRLSPERLKRLRMVAPCRREMLVWARLADSPDERAAVDIDLLDMRGNICLEMRGLSFHVDEESAEPVEPRTWLFSTQQRVALDGQAPQQGPLGPTETIELFLRQEAALALRKPQDEIAADRTYFDLGFSSAASARFIDALNNLLGEELSAGVLFDHRDIRSLAADLSSRFPEKIAALTVVPMKIEHPSPARPRRALSPLPRSRRYASGAEGAWPERESDTVSDLPPSDLPPSGEEVLAQVLWNDAPVDDMYEKLTF